jgi:hypothetical protein
MGRAATHSIAITENGTPDVVTALSVESMNLPANVELTEDNSGALYDTLIGVKSVKPEMTFTTKSIAKMLKLFGINGGCFGASPALKRVDQFYEGKRTCGNPSAPNISFGANKGLYYLDTLTFPRGEEATISAKCDLMSSDGTTAPVSMTNPATLPTTVNVDSYVVGPPKIADITFNEGTGGSLRFGVQKDEDQVGWGSVYVTDGGIIKVRPELTIDNADLALLDGSGIPLNGMDAVHAETQLSFRKKKNRAAFEPDDSAVHFVMTLSGYFFFDVIAGGQGRAAGSNSLRLRAAKESTTAPIVLTFAVAYGNPPVEP